MKCLLVHSWGWPRRRSGRDVQVCVDCGMERVSSIQFEAREPAVAVPVATVEPALLAPQPLALPARTHSGSGRLMLVGRTPEACEGGAG